MTRVDAILPLLQAWSTQMIAHERAVESLRASVGVVPEAPLIRAIADMQLLATRSVSTVVGDAGEWCEWYWLENDMGARAGRVVPGAGCRERPVRRVKDLARVIVQHARVIERPAHG